MEHAKEYIERSRQGLVTAGEGLAEKQWSFKPSPECWSIAEILEHVALTNEMILGHVCKLLAAAPPPPADHGRDRDQIDALIVNGFPDRSAKFKGPEGLMPTGRPTPSESLGRLNQSCAGLAQYLDATPDLREHAVDSPPLKAVSRGAYQFIDGYQLMLAMGGHMQRHTRQILEVKAGANFPVHEDSHVPAA